MKKVIFLMGPTAAGKTNAVIELAKIMPIDIISVDSSMIYKGMDIGTGKPSKEELQVAPHKLIDIIEPNQSYSAADFCNDAVKLVEKSFKNERLPILVGGTMMYFNALKKGISPLPSADKEIRSKLYKEIEQHGLHYLHKKLESLDPISAKRINPNDSQRIQRALEVIEITGKTMGELFVNNKSFIEGWDIKEFAIAPSNREILHYRIKLRFEQMLKDGFVNEVEELVKKYSLSLDFPSLRSVGYRQIYNYLQGNCTYEEMIEKALAATRQLAKRQYTWLRSFNNIEWLDSESKNIIENIITGKQ